MILVTLVILCLVFFALCYLGTGTDEKNLKNYMSYPDEVQEKIKNIGAYQGKFKETSKVSAFIANFIIFSILFLLLGLKIRQKSFVQNFMALFILGQGLNIFDLVLIDLLWWRRTKRIRFSKIPGKSLYQNPKKHIEAFERAFLMYFFIALVDGYILTLF
ncbi:ABC transporter permease [uncultured Anaerococcus sp.]|uniref:ABC transporter permease n=1 Tax=uncultured Anaerococcus sp. TaxID=293428 RepID=UPI002889FDFC|nr:ABC transporter permease [uncultured Anaerococcus sp.]